MTISPEKKVRVSPAEFGRQNSLSTMTIYRMVKQGRIPYVRLGKSIRIDPDAAVAALHKEQGGADDA